MERVMPRGILELEKRLARDARGGDQRALAKIFSEYHQPLYRYCLAIVGDRQDAEDVLQETMIKVLRALPGEQREIALRPWLYRIAHNESIELLRRRRASVALEGSEPAARRGPAEEVEARERLRQLISDLGVLPERQRGVLLMREAAGLDFDEIGAALGTSPAVARQTLYEARLGLREMDSGREMRCTAVTEALSDGDGRVRRRRDLRAHLRVCLGCQAFAGEIDGRRAELAAIAPLPAVAAAALLHGVFAGGAGAGAVAAGGAGAGAGAAGSGAAGLGSLAAGTAAKTIGTATLLKGAAAVAVVAALCVGAADRGGLLKAGHQGPAPAPHSIRPNPAAESAPTHAGAASASGRDEPRRGSATQAEVSQPGARARARHLLGPATATPPRSPERSAVSVANQAPPNPDGTESAEESAAAAPADSGAEHPSGRGHEKQTSPDAAHGQETAAANHAAHEAEETPSSDGAAEHPAHPEHPTHPAKPEKPVRPEQPSKPEKSTKPEESVEPEKPAKPEKPEEETALPPATESPPAAAAEHAAEPPGQTK
jgi:RNA polymerase sigma factor (sigma-70 family)